MGPRFTSSDEWNWRSLQHDANKLDRPTNSGMNQSGDGAAVDETGSVKHLDNELGVKRFTVAAGT